MILEEKSADEKKACEISQEANSKKGTSFGFGCEKDKGFFKPIGLVYEGMEAHCGRIF